MLSQIHIGLVPVGLTGLSVTFDHPLWTIDEDFYEGFLRFTSNTVIALSGYLAYTDHH